MTGFNALRSPLSFLQSGLQDIPHRDVLDAEEGWWRSEGVGISDAIDRAGTPWLRMFDRLGKRVDEILYPREYQTILRRGYRSGVVWRALEEKSLIPTYSLIYNISFYDPGICCPYTVSLGTVVPLAKYGSAELQNRFLAQLSRKDDSQWQGATWMTEIKGGSDLGVAVETIARPVGDCWLLTGDKYFASNASAELAVVAARAEGAAAGVRGLALFLVPRYRKNGELNYFIRRLKDKIATRSVPTGEVELRDSEGYLLGSADSGIYLILEVLNLSRVANSVVSVALAQRAMADALSYAERRAAFGKRIFDHPLLRHQFEDWLIALRSAFALAWDSVQLLNEVWMERPPYPDRYHLFRLVAHLAKYWTAEFAVDTAKWAMEVHGGLGVLAEYGAERWLREAMILAIWEGTSHRQMLDGLEVIERKRAHKMLFQHLAEIASSKELQDMESEVEQHLKLPPEEKEALAEPLFKRLAAFTAKTLARKSK
ncbi:MAG TPA: acyl-CoA dehydrogenase family protein [Candidatus Dormibacteraeota bacterium]|nr:acyl-CoA dehydrogenase family protein [Candidatus Dormibacteraeota bacterium]